MGASLRSRSRRGRRTRALCVVRGPLGSGKGASTDRCCPHDPRLDPRSTLARIGSARGARRSSATNSSFPSGGIMQRLTRVGVLSVAKHLALLDALLGLVASCIAVLTAFVQVIAGDMGSAVVSIVFAILAPFLYGVLGFVVGAL